MRYPLTITPEPDGTFRVQVDDIPDAITASDDIEHAQEMAMDAFRAVAESYADANTTIPMPSKPRRGQTCIDIPVVFAAKILLHNEMQAQNIRPSDLARRMNTRPQDINRIIKLDAYTRIDTLESALHALGRSLQLTVTSK